MKSYFIYNIKNYIYLPFRKMIQNQTLGVPLQMFPRRYIISIMISTMFVSSEGSDDLKCEMKFLPVLLTQ